MYARNWPLPLCVLCGPVPSVRAEKSVKGKLLEKEVNISPQLLPNEEAGVGGRGGCPIKARKFRYLPPRQDQKHSAEPLKILYHKMNNF